MKRPTWATVVGILGIVFGALGLISGAWAMITPAIMDMQKDMMGDFREVAKEARREARNPRDPRDRPRPPPPEMDRFFGRFEKMFDIPQWYKTWSIVAGFMTMIICGAYIFAAISLLTVKRFGISLFYWMSGAAIAFNLTKALVAMGVASILMVNVWMYAALGIVVDVVLVSVVATSEKMAFEAALDVVEVEEVG